MTPTVPAGLESALSDRYRLERELGRGGMATVYLARDLKHDREVAIKVLRPKLASELGAERFLNEIRTTAALQHPHILPLFDSGQAGEFLFYAMPYVAGESLRDRLAREGQLPMADALRIAADVASALDYAHRRDIIHRDIKPENILLYEGNAIVADFGIALALSQAGKDRLTATGLSIGTPQYMSPEQATSSNQLDARSDIYSLGAVLYEMLAGEAPFTGPSVRAVIAKLLTEEPMRLRTVRDTVPADVEAAVQRALATSAVDRFATAAEFALALANAAAPLAGTRTTAWIRSIAVGFLALAVLGTAGWWLVRDRIATTSLPELERVQLTFTGNASAPSVSPDGKRVAYVVKECDDYEYCAGDIVITDVPATKVLTVVRGVRKVIGMDWTSDGRFLVYGAWGGAQPGSYLVSALGGTPRFVGGGTATQLGATDTLIEAGSLPKGGWLRVVPMSSGIAVDSVQVPVLRQGDFDVYSSPAGDRIAVTQYENDSAFATLLVVDRNGVVHDSLSMWMHDVVWAPAGDALVVTSWRRRREYDVLRLELGQLSSGTIRVDTVASQLPLVQGSFSIGRTGIAAYAESRTEWMLVTFSRPTGAPTDVAATLLASGTGPSPQAFMEPSGKRILLNRQPGLSASPLAQPVLIPFEGGEPGSVGPPRTSFNVNWSADGTHVLSEDTGTDRTTLLEIDPVTGVGKAIGGVLAPPDEVVGLAGGGAVAAACVETQCHLHLRGVPGRPDTSLATPWDHLGFLQARPDGQAVAGMTVLDDSATSFAIVEFDLRSGSSQVLLRFPGSDDFRLANWTDNTHIEFFRPLANATGWYRLETTSGTITQVGKILQPTGRTYSLSADGRRGVAVVRRQRSDIILLPNFAERLR